jgi:hypothetical protein
VQALLKEDEMSFRHAAFLECPTAFIVPTCGKFKWIFRPIHQSEYFFTLSKRNDAQFQQSLGDDTPGRPFSPSLAVPSTARIASMAVE